MNDRHRASAANDINSRYLPDIARIVCAVALLFGVAEYIWGNQTLGLIDLSLALWTFILILRPALLSGSAYGGELVLLPGLLILLASTYFTPDPGYLWSFIGASCLFFLSRGAIGVTIAVVFIVMNTGLVYETFGMGLAIRVAAIMATLAAVSYFVTSRLRAVVNELRSQRVALEQAQQVQTQFIDDVSHEMRTPLTAILGFTERLLEAPSASGQPEQTVMLREVHKNARVLAIQINDLIDSSELRSGTLPIHVESIPVQPFVDEFVVEATRLRDELQENPTVSIQGVIDPAVPKALNLDAGHVSAILMRLVLNSLKEESASRVEIRLGYESHRQMLTLGVRDNSPGIEGDQDDRDNPFDPFSPSAKRQDGTLKGLGLGLHVSRSIARKLGGDLVYAPASPGRLFTLSLPAPLTGLPESASDVAGREPETDDGNTGTREHEPVSDGCKEAPLHILLADDSQTNRMLIRMLLQDLDCQCTEVSDGQEAVDTFDASVHDVILMDIQMPVLSGIEAAEQLRARGVTAPIIAVSAGTSAMDAAEADDRLFNDHIGKPIDLEKFRRVLARVMPRPVDALSS